MFALVSAGQQGPPDDRGIFGNSLLLPLAAVIIILLIIVIVILLFPRLNSVKVTKPLEIKVHEVETLQTMDHKTVESPIEVTLKLLQEDERRVVEALREAEGSMLQKDLSYDLKFSRVKTHRVLMTLIERGVVSAEKHYNTNKITLADWLKPNDEPQKKD